MADDEWAFACSLQIKMKRPDNRGIESVLEAVPPVSVQTGKLGAPVGRFLRVCRLVDLIM